MMLLERWAVAAILGLGLVSTAGAPGQSQAPQPADAQTDAEPADEPAHYVPAPLPPDPTAPAPAAPESPAPASATPESAAPAPATPESAAPESAVSAPASAAHTPSADPVQRQLEKDTEHLLQLVQGLKLEVEKAGTNTLSLAALRRADEIQRLAKSLKERMREREQVPAGKP